MTKKNAIFIVVGRLGKNLVLSKTWPILHTDLFKDIYVFCETEFITIPGINFITLPKIIRNIKLPILKKIIRIVFEPLQLIIKSYKFNPAIIHGFYIMPKGLNSLIASKFSKSICIISIIGGKEEIETSLPVNFISKFVNIQLLKSADFITTKGLRDNHYLTDNRINQNKMSIFNGAIDTGKFCYKGESKDIDILFSGYYDMNKGPQRALQIISKVIAELSDLKVIFIGTGPLLKNMIQLAQELGLSEKIIFRGFVDNPEYYYKHAKILVFPSANEGLSTAMLEAMACQCVPVTSNVGNQTEAAIHNMNSIVISDYMDIASFTSGIIKLLKDADLLSKLALNAERTILDKYTVNAQAEIYKNICSQLLP
jgi:glycosyltransferase involved in cell wall biosynthesis